MRKGSAHGVKGDEIRERDSDMEKWLYNSKGQMTKKPRGIMGEKWEVTIRKEV